MELIGLETYPSTSPEPVHIFDISIPSTSDIPFIKKSSGKPSVFIDPFTVPKTEAQDEGSYKFMVAFDGVNSAKVVFFQRQDKAFIEVYPEGSDLPVMKVPTNEIAFGNYRSIFVASSTKGRISVGLVEAGSLGGLYNAETMSVRYPKVNYVSFDF